MVSRNRQIANVHLHKLWKERVKCWFDQPARKQRRRLTRQRKATKISPRPIEGLLRPAVRCPTVRYNMRLRAGRGFTPAELREAKITPVEARSIGIAVDQRRTNRSDEAFRMNVQRLKLYKSKLLLFPLHPAKPKATDAKPEELKTVKQLHGPVLGVKQVREHIKPREITAAEKKLRMTKRNSKLLGDKKKKQDRKAAAAAKKEKKEEPK